MKSEKGSPAYIYIFALLAMIFWGMSFIWTSIVFDYYPPITTIFLRLVISSTFLFIILAVSGFLQRIRREHFLLFLLSAIFNPFFYFLGENYGLKYSTPSISAVVIATIPVFTPFAAWFMIREKVSRLNIAGIMISFTGILVMLIRPDFSFATDPLGVILLLLAVVSAVIYSILLKRLTKHYTPVNIIAWQNLLGVIFFLPLFLLLDFGEFMAVVPDSRLLIALFSLAIIASSMAYVLFATTIKHIGVNRANVYSNLIPVTTVIASYFILDEVFTGRKVLGIIIVILGVFITQINKLRNK
ncbi:MAG: DMT family transporter [Bacteroidales bacterium]|nr:DMT family transporter [Bacteroidales bacterium]